MSPRYLSPNAYIFMLELKWFAVLVIENQAKIHHRNIFRLKSRTNANVPGVGRTAA